MLTILMIMLIVLTLKQSQTRKTANALLHHHQHWPEQDQRQRCGLWLFLRAAEIVTTSLIESTGSCAKRKGPSTFAGPSVRPDNTAQLKDEGPQKLGLPGTRTHKNQLWTQICHLKHYTNGIWTIVAYFAFRHNVTRMTTKTSGHIPKDRQRVSVSKCTTYGTSLVSSIGRRCLCVCPSYGPFGFQTIEDVDCIRSDWRLKDEIYISMLI